MISTYIPTWFIIFCCCLYFVRRFAAESVKIQQNLGDRTARVSTFGSMILFFKIFTNAPH